MSKDHYEICKGCTSYGFTVIRDNKKILRRSCMIENPVISPTNQCPCITCILKVMCNHICADFIDYIMQEAQSRKGVDLNEQQ